MLIAFAMWFYTEIVVTADVEHVRSMPEFDAEMFEKITRIETIL